VHRDGKFLTVDFHSKSVAHARVYAALWCPAVREDGGRPDARSPRKAPSRRVGRAVGGALSRLEAGSRCGQTGPAEEEVATCGASTRSARACRARCGAGNVWKKVYFSR
jgi:hypothetical protein